MKIVHFDHDGCDKNSQFDRVIEKVAPYNMFDDVCTLVVDKNVISEIESHPEEYDRLKISEIPDSTTDFEVLVNELEYFDEIERSFTILYVVDGKIHYLD